MYYDLDLSLINLTYLKNDIPIPIKSFGHIYEYNIETLSFGFSIENHFPFKSSC